jgi:hypothetical protein
MQYPHHRKKLIHNLRALADPDYQTRVWVDFEVPYHPYCDEFGEVVHFIFDDMDLDTRLEQAIGRILENSAEAEAVETVVESLDKVLDSAGPNASDEVYVNSRYWGEVISAARQAHNVLTKGQQPEGLFEHLQKQGPVF